VPLEPQGAHPDPNRRGCPSGDRDHDGITDDADRCPDQAETFNGRDDTDGCPDGDALGVREGGQIRIMEQVLPQQPRTIIQGRRSFAVLDAVSRSCARSPDISQLDVQGHTDDRGSADRNRTLSASARTPCVQYLTQHGVESRPPLGARLRPRLPARPGHARAAPAPPTAACSS
jgi:OOP family OmpA-OmpF porin